MVASRAHTLATYFYVNCLQGFLCDLRTCKKVIYFITFLYFDFRLLQRFIYSKSVISITSTLR